MMRAINHTRTKSPALLQCLLGGCFAAALSLTPSLGLCDAKATYMYKLSDFSGDVPSLWARVAVNPELGEVYALNREDAAIQIYNQEAMQIFGFGEDLGLSSALDITSGQNGDLYVLYSNPLNRILHLDYKGAPLSEIVPRDLPDTVRGFQGNFIVLKNDSFYLADSEAMQVLVLSAEGKYENHIDLRQLLAEQINKDLSQADLRASQERKLQDDLKALSSAEINGFAVGNQGEIYFTAATLFSAFRYKLDGTLEQFGISGGAVGKFGVISGIEADAAGRIYVTDRLRCVVLVFDKDFQFMTEFGYRGAAPQNLIVPDDVAINDQNDTVYVSQAANLGVSVYKLQFDTN